MSANTTDKASPVTAEDDVLARVIVENSLDAIITFSRAGFVTSFNPAAERLFGFAAEETLGHPIERLLMGERRGKGRNHKQADAMWKTLAADGISHECIGRTKDGDPLDLEISVSRAKTRSGPVFVAVLRDVSVRRKEDAQTRFLAHFDSLTKLPNRVLFEERVGQAIAQAKRSGGILGLMMLDLDRFKQVNDTLGHQVGDLLLAAVAKRLSAGVRETDTVTRLGGDEFAVLVTNLTDPDGAATVGETIVTSLAQPFDLDGERLVTSASIGIATYPADGADVEILLRNADMALYRAKAKGRNTYQFYVPEMDALVQARKALERDLRLALDAGELALEYQPVIEADGGTIAGVEALIRWNDRERGSLAAHEFIPVVERTDLILRLGKWVMRQACGQARAWREAGLPALKLSVNLSPAELHQRDLVSELANVLEETGMDPHDLQLEFSEEAFMLAVQKNTKTLDRLREMGVSISLDNFGSGASSIEFLKRHPVDRLKIDRSFLDKLDGGDSGKALLGPLIGLARGVGAGVTIECVETREHLEQALAGGAEEMQGHFLSEPVAAERLAELLRAGGPLRPGGNQPVPAEDLDENGRGPSGRLVGLGKEGAGDRDGLGQADPLEGDAGRKGARKS